MAKVGRNQPCTCGSGKKYKHCHGKLAGAAPPGLMEAIQRSRREHEAAEQIRTQQQGYGRGIIHMEANGHNVVAVGNTIYTSPSWRYFPDFLLDFLQKKLAPLAADHPVPTWHSKLADLRQDKRPGEPSYTPFGGFAASLFYLAYSLYLLEHHDQIPASLIKRLRHAPLALPAAYEAFVGAAFALSGYTLKSEEAKATALPSGEFTATSKRTGRTYSVEAKRKDGWKAPFEGTLTEPFKAELRAYLIRVFKKAARKRLPNPVYWFELSIPNLKSEAEFHLVRSEVQSILADAEETLLVMGAKPEPAYVFITNHAHLANDDLSATSLFGALEAFRMPTYLREGVQVEVEYLLECYDEHRDMTSVIKCLAEVKRVPMSFDATPDELVRPDGTVASPPKVGERLAYQQPDGSTVTGVLEDVTSFDDKAAILLREDGTGRQVIGQIPLTPEEAAAVRIHGDAIFGKGRSGRKLADGDFFGLYDWLLETYRSYDRQALLNQVRDHPSAAEFMEMPLPDLHIRVAREVFKASMMHRAAETPSAAA